MKHKFLYSTVLLLLIVGLYMPASYSAALNPHFTCTLTNDVKVNAYNYKFDIYLLRTSTDAMRYYAGQWDFSFDNSVLNGGTLTAAIVDQSWDAVLDASGQAPNPVSIFTGEIRLAHVSAGGNLFAAVISNTAPGTKVGTLLLTNSVPFLGSPANVQLMFSGYGTKVSAYNNSTTSNNSVADFTANGSFVNQLANAPLPVEISSFASTAQGHTIVLNWSTKTEKNSDRFEVERSLASTTDWKTIVSVTVAVLSKSPKNYTYSDTKLQSGKYQYRLKIVDTDGTISYSNVVETEIAALPKSFALSQNYPNPFNPSTKIDYQVPVDARVILEVYNIAGQKVAELVNKDQPAGFYTVEFGSTDKLASGVYIYRMTMSDKATNNNFSAIKKMMLLK